MMDAVARFGRALIDDPNRIETTAADGLDEVLFCRLGRFRHRMWSTQIVDVARRQFIDVVPGCGAASTSAWFAAQPAEWCERIEWATLDLSGPYRAVFATMLPDAVQFADPFRVVKVADTAFEGCRHRAQNETLGHRGRKHDPLYRARRRLVMGRELLTKDQHDRLMGLPLG